MRNNKVGSIPLLPWSLAFAVVLAAITAPAGPQALAHSRGSCQASPENGCCTCGNGFCEDGAVTGGVVCDDDYCPTDQPHCWVSPGLE